MTQEDQHDNYFRYLASLSWRGALYRKYWLHPRVAGRLRGRTLDVGCGIGDMLAHRPGTIGVDVNSRTVAFCQQRGLAAHLMEFDRLPFEAASFDTVLMDNVIEHISAPQPLLSEVLRVLGPGGRLVAGVPGRCGWDSDPDHKVFYDEGTMVRSLEAAGFTWRECFYTPLWRSAWLDRRLRQYCVYGVFDVAGPPDESSRR